MRPQLRTFDHFPDNKKCIVCGTSEDDKCVLIPIQGTENGNIAEAEPIHLACAIPQYYSKEIGVLYRKV